MTKETVLPELVGTLAKLPEHTQATIRAYGSACARIALQSLPVQTSSAIRGDSYAGVYVWVGNENLVQHIPKVLAQTANDPQSMLGAVAAKCIQELKQFSELQSPEIQALRNQDPLQGAANWIVEALTNCDVTDIQYQLIIGYNRAKRLFDVAMEQQT